MIAKKDTSERAWCKFVWHGSGDIGITQASENMKIVIGWRRPKEDVMRCIVPPRFAWPNVEKKCGGSKSIWPKLCRHVCMENQSTNTLIKCVKNTFGTAVLLECVWTS